MEWIGQLQQRFGSQGKILVCLEQSRGALIYHLMDYEFFELYPVNPLQLARYRETFSPGGAKDDLPDADLLSELVYYHRDRLRAWKPDSAMTRKLAFFNEGRREAVDQRTRLSNVIKSQLKVYFPLALELLDNDTSTALAADLLLKWPSLEALQKQNSYSLRKFFYAHNCRRESKMLQRLKLVQQAKPLTQDEAVIEPAVLRIQMLARQLKTLLPDIAHYEENIAELFAAHLDRFLFDNLPGAGRVLRLPGYAAPWAQTPAAGNQPRRSPPCMALPRCGAPAAKRPASRPAFTSATLVRSSFASPFTNSAPVPYVTAPGPKPITPANGLGAKAITPPCGRSLSNGRILFACWKHRIPYDPQRYRGQGADSPGSARLRWPGAVPESPWSFAPAKASDSELILGSWLNAKIEGFRFVKLKLCNR
jgi:hypothetical protein